MLRILQCLFFSLLFLLPCCLTQVIKLPPRTRPFRVHFSFPDEPPKYQQSVVTIAHNLDVALTAKQLIEMVFRRPNPWVEKQVVARIMEKVQVYNSEDHRSYDLQLSNDHDQQPLFSINISNPSLPSSNVNPKYSIEKVLNPSTGTATKKKKPVRIISSRPPSKTKDEVDAPSKVVYYSTLHFFPNDSPQFALKRFHHQQEIFNDNDLYTREAIIASLHQKRLIHTKQTCASSQDFKQCLINHCISHKPKFPGYEVQEPSSIKNAIVVAAAYRYRVQDCVETGTYQGDTTLLLAKEVCNKVYTIELSSKFANKAMERFQNEIDHGNEKDSNNARKISLFEGDSGDVLNADPIFQSLRRTMWFLDGHYSYLDTARGQDDSPVIRELEFILNRKGYQNDIILIDDAREFRGNRFPTDRLDEIPDGGVLVYPELDDIIDKICYLAPEALVDLVDDVLIVRHLQSSTII